MRTIKTRDMARGTIRTIQKGKNASGRIREGAQRTWQSGDQAAQQMQQSASDYASLKFEGASKTAARKTAQLGKKSLRAARKASQKVLKRSIKTAEKGAKQTVKISVKTAKTSAKASIKAAKETVKLTQRLAKIAKLIAKATVTIVKTAVKITATIIKMIIAAVKALIAALAAGGWIPVVILLIVCVVILLLVTIYGIFFADDTGYSVKEVVREIDDEYDAKIWEIKEENEYDIVSISGERAPWKEVLAVFAAYSRSEDEKIMEAFHIGDAEKEQIRDIFWTMNDLDSEMKKEVVYDEETEKMKIIDCLYITVEALSADEAASHYVFTREEREAMHDLLSPTFDALWARSIYGISDGSSEIVAVAAEQIGNVGGEKFWSWYGFSERVEWCACFVSWCANECGLIEADKLPMFSYCDPAIFKERGQWRDTDYTPSPGDLVFFDWISDGYQDGEADHVGIVEKVEDGVLYTIEGNRSNACGRFEYAIDDPVLYGYIVVE